MHIGFFNCEQVTKSNKSIYIFIEVYKEVGKIKRKSLKE